MKFKGYRSQGKHRAALIVCSVGMRHHGKVQFIKGTFSGVCHLGAVIFFRWRSVNDDLAADFIDDTFQRDAGAAAGSAQNIMAAAVTDSGQCVVSA